VPNLKKRGRSTHRRTRAAVKSREKLKQSEGERGGKRPRLRSKKGVAYDKWEHSSCQKRMGWGADATLVSPNVTRRFRAKVRKESSVGKGNYRMILAESGDDYRRGNCARGGREPRRADKARFGGGEPVNAGKGKRKYRLTIPYQRSLSSRCWQKRGKTL